MTTQQKLELLQECPLFHDIDPHELFLLAEKAIEKIFRPQSIILSQDKVAENVLFIFKGLIKVYILTSEGKIVPIRMAGPMYIAGELNIIDNEKTATIETIQETHVLTLRVETCKKLLKTNPIFAYNLLKIITKKLRTANQQTEYYYSTPLKDKALQTMQTLSAHFPNKEIVLSQDELANIIGANRSKVTEALRQLQNQRLISIEYKKIRVL